MTVKFTTTFAFAFIIFFAQITFAQKEYTVSWHTESEGLPQNSVKSIFKDKYGYIWLSTENGLVRYDGHEFKVFNSSNISGSSSNRMWFFEGSSSKDSVYTINSALDLLLIKERKVSRIPDSLHVLSTKRVQTEIPFYYNYTAMLAGTHEVYLHDLYQNFIFENGLFKVDIDSIYEQNLSGKLKHAYKHNFVDRSHYFVQEKSLYQFIAGKKLYRFQQGQTDSLPIASSTTKDAKIYTNHVAQQVFLYDRSTLFVIDSVSQNSIHKTPIIEDYNLEEHAISSILYDRANDRVYLGSYIKGVGIVKKTYFNAIRTDVGRNNNVEYALAKLNDSTFITGSGAVIQNDITIASNDFSEISNKFHITVDKNGNVWTKINNRLFLLEDQGNYNFTAINEWRYDEKTVFSVLQSKNENELWLSTVGVAKDEGTLYKLQIDQPDTPIEIITTDFNITALIEIDENNLYIGSKHGLYLLKNYTSQNPSLEKIEDNIDVRGFYKDGSNFWVTTYDKSFLLIQNIRLISFPADPNNFLISAHCIVEDKNNFFWIPTNKGLFKVAKDNLYDYAKNKTKEVYYQYFDKSYGFLNNEFNGGCYPCGITLENEKIYFPSLSGIVGFLPSKTNTKTNKKNIYIDEVEIDGKRQFIKDSLEIDRNFDRIKFYISSPSFEHRHNNRIEVQLKSNTNTQDWTAIDKDQTISYTNLPPGTYTLVARKLLGFDFDYQYKKITLIIPPAFWQTLWFQLLMVLSGVLLMLFLVHLIINYFKNKNLVLEKKINSRTEDLNNAIEILKETKKDLKNQLWFQKGLVNSISHDLKTPMKYLSLTSKYVLEFPNKNEEEKENLELIYHSSTQMLNYVDRLIFYAKANLNEINHIVTKVHLHDVFEECESFFKLALTMHNIEFKNTIPNDIYLQTNRQVLKIIIQNILDNAIKNTTNGTIWVTAKNENEQISITVKDSGTGMPVEKLDQYRLLFNKTLKSRQLHELTGLGLKMIIQLLPIIQATIELKSEIGKGTTFIIILPKNM